MLVELDVEESMASAALKVPIYANILPGGRRGGNRKRLCKREAEMEDDATSEHSEGNQEDNAFLIEVMLNLAARSKLDVTGHLKDKKDAHELANKLHDSLIEVWDGPQQESSEQHEALQQKADVWNRHRRSLPPKPSQHERTPRASPFAPQPSPATVQKAVESATAGRPAWDMTLSKGRTTASEWGNTNTIG